MKIDPAAIIREVTFKAVRAGGRGGQHVNKVSTKVELSFDIGGSTRFSEAQKRLLFQKLKNRISDKGILKLTCDTERSQWANKMRVFEKFLVLLTRALTPVKKRIPSKPSRQSREKRIREKKAVSEKKAWRKRTGLE